MPRSPFGAGQRGKEHLPSRTLRYTICENALVLPNQLQPKLNLARGGSRGGNLPRGCQRVFHRRSPGENIVRCCWKFAEINPVQDIEKFGAEFPLSFGKCPRLGEAIALESELGKRARESHPAGSGNRMR